ncbi:hypothetical protein D9M72_617090 [compost metagenome]
MRTFEFFKAKENKCQQLGRTIMQICPDPPQSEFIDSGELAIGFSDFALKGGIV